MTQQNDEPRQMNVANYARYEGVSYASIAQAINRGEIVPLDNGLIDVAQAKATYGRRRAERAALRGSNLQTVEKRSRALLQRTIAQMAMMQKRAEELHGSVVPRDASQADVNGQTIDVRSRVTFASGTNWQMVAKTVLLGDLGDVQSEAHRVTR